MRESRGTLSQMNWKNMHSISNHNDADECLLIVFSGIYNLACFLKISG